MTGGRYEKGGEQVALGAEVQPAGSQDSRSQCDDASSGRLEEVSCYRPLQAWQGPGGGRPLIGRPTHGVDGRFLELPCGKCIGCFMDRGLMWKTRIIHESLCWPESVMVTLQYRDDALPASFSLEYSHFQLFMKRLRFDLTGVGELPDGRKPIRFFVAGEYGGKTFRPHWHAVLFNARLDDARWWTRKGLSVGHSERLEALWSHGYAELAPVNSRTAAYVAGYVHKKARRRALDVIDTGTGELLERRAEFQKQSNDPGLGSYWYERFGRDLFPLDGAVVDGRVHKVPRYYWLKAQGELPPATVDAIRARRIGRARELPEEESSLERRAVREEAAQLRQDAFGQRGL